jgi:hypothetical protein
MLLRLVLYMTRLSESHSLVISSRDFLLPRPSLLRVVNDLLISDSLLRVILNPFISLH